MQKDILIVIEAGPSRTIECTELHRLLIVVLIVFPLQDFYIPLILSRVVHAHPQISQHGRDSFVYKPFYKCSRNSASNCVYFIGQHGFAEKHHSAQGLLAGITIIVQLTSPIGEHAFVKREDIVILGEFGIDRGMRGEGILGETCLLFGYSRDVQFGICDAIPTLRGIISSLHRTYTVFHTVTGIAADFQRVNRPLLCCHRRKVINGFRQAAVRQAQHQFTILKVEKLSTAVGGAHQEVVERLVILYEIGLYELMAFAAFSVHQVLLVIHVGFYQGDAIGQLSEVQALRL